MNDEHDPRPYPEGPAPRSARTTSGEDVSHAELRLAAEVSRLPARFGSRLVLDGFLAWRAYVVLRGTWRLKRRLGRRR